MCFVQILSAARSAIGKPMNSLHLEYFVRVAELGSINKAATDLRLSQPALSRNISLLEREMGTSLFVRNSNGVRLTEAGKLLYEKTNPLLRQFAILKEQIGEMAEGHVAIGFPPSWRHIITTKFAVDMVSMSSQVHLQISENVSHILRSQLMDGVLDLCVVPIDPAIPDEYRQTPLVTEPMILVASIDEGLNPKKPISIKELEGRKLILPSRPNYMRAKIEHEFAQSGKTMRASLETDTLNLCLELSRQGIGTTVVPGCAIIGSPFYDEISWTPIKGLTLKWGLIENSKRSHSLAVRECRRYVLKAVTKILAQKQWYKAQKVKSAVNW